MDIIKVVGTKENCTLFEQAIPFDCEKIKKSGTSKTYTAYYEIDTEEDGSPSIEECLNIYAEDGWESANIENIKDAAKSGAYCYIPLSKYSELLQLNVTVANVKEPYNCPWNDEWLPPSLDYFQYNCGTRAETVTDIDAVLKERAEALMETFGTMDEDGEYFVP